MNICIHRGTHEIGGTCIEIELDGKRIVLDVGLPLDDSNRDLVLPPVKGFDKPDTSLLGVVISHPHQDHYGLARVLPEETMFLIGEAACNILSAAEVFTPGGITLKNVIYLSDRQPIKLGPFTITPYLVDHSAYDAYAILIEGGGKRIFYTGDLRGHGRKSNLFDRLLQDPPKNVNAMLMEGTTIGRTDTDKGFPSEDDIEAEMVKIFVHITGMPLVCCSGQNIDRLVTVFRACKKAERMFIVDMYTAHILHAIGNKHLPQAEWPEIRVFLPYFQKRRIIRQNDFDIANQYKAHRIYPERLAGIAMNAVMLFRPSMTEDLERAGCLDGACLVYSMWDGYLRKDDHIKFLAWLEGKGIPLIKCHTSGHASQKDLKRLREAFSGAKLIPVHTDDPSAVRSLFADVLEVSDGITFTI